MKIVLTTVLSASCKIDGKVISSINRGLLLLVGFTSGDNEEIVSKMVDKILSLRVFCDDSGLTNLSLKDVDGKILSISQFTLYANCKKGRRPSFVDALNPKDANKLYDYFNELILNKNGEVDKGIFGADMKIESINDGPFTLVLDSKELF